MPIFLKKLKLKFKKQKQKQKKRKKVAQPPLARQFFFFFLKK
jgi:hypothetical protein